MDLTHNKCVAAQKQTYDMWEGDQLSELFGPGFVWFSQTCAINFNSLVLRACFIPLAFFLLHLSGPALSLPPINFLVQSTSTSPLIQTWQGNPMLENYTVAAGRNPKSPPERECNCRGTTRSTFMRCCIPAYNP